MSSKKMYYILTVGILAILIAGLASATNIGHSGGADPDRGISIEGIEFNIPNGYMKNESKSIVNQSNSSENMTYVLNQETYVNVAGEEIVITVLKFDDYDVDSQMLYRICQGADEKKIMGYPGYMTGNENFAQFAYAYDNRGVSIQAPNEKVINQVLVPEDA
ncbi:MAG: hypothetical protein BZ137_01600 [Methanosphaera sp. rholeuAM130]|nr:MAG: hypothetical protein BZ137_01600 [Methanosphaera sp. rholeuAM130]